MRTSIKIIIALLIIGGIFLGIWLSLDSHTKCKLIYGKNICNFYKMMDIVNHSPESSNFEKVMQLCQEMEDVPKKDGCFEFVAEAFTRIDIEKAEQACNEIKGFDNVKSKENCYIKIQELSLKEEFCGRSSYGECSSDLDCTTGGCSNHVCQSKKEESIITTCEWRDCYNAKIYNFSCKCVESKCQWSE